MTLEEPSQTDSRWIDAQVARTRQLVAEGLAGASLYGNQRDLSTLQELIKRSTVTDVDSDDLVALGVFFGVVLISALPELEWVIADDEYGREAVLRYRATTVTVNPISMIAGRLERREELDFVDLFQSTLAALPAVVDESRQA